MLSVYIGSYTLFLVCIWGFFIVARIHVFKFKTFSPHIVKVTQLLTGVLALLSVLGYIILFMFVPSLQSNTLPGINPSQIQEQNLDRFKQNYY